MRSISQFAAYLNVTRHNGGQQSTAEPGRDGAAQGSGEGEAHGEREHEQSGGVSVESVHQAEITRHKHRVRGHPTKGHRRREEPCRFARLRVFDAPATTSDEHGAEEADGHHGGGDSAHRHGDAYR